LRKFIFTYYIGKYKQQFIDFYYKRIVEPKVIIKSHPSNLYKMIEENPEVELEQIINKFENIIDTI
jgi:hypothetical protein